MDNVAIVTMKDSRESRLKGRDCRYILEPSHGVTMKDSRESRLKGPYRITE